MKNLIIPNIHKAADESTTDEFKALIVQGQKDSAIQSLLYVSKKLGEVEGMISCQTIPDEKLVKVQQDFSRIYQKLVKEAGIELHTEPTEVGIGRDSV